MRRSLVISFVALALWSFEASSAQSANVSISESQSNGAVDTDDVEPVCVVARKARLRVKPSSKAKVSWVVGQHMPLERLGTKDGWSRVRDLRGQVHWVISRAVSPNLACAVVRVRTAPLLSGPGPKAPPAGFKSADRYTAFKRVDREIGWVRLEDNYKGSFWTQESNLWIPIKRSQMEF